MKLSVFFDIKKSDGGAYHQNLKTVELLSKLKNIDLNIITPDKKTYNLFKDKKIKTLIYNINFVDRLFYALYSLNILKLFFKKINFNNKFEKFLKNNQIDLIYFLSNSRTSILCNKTNFFSYIYEIHHLFRPDLPEYKGWHDFDLREEITQNTIKKASIIFVDTKIKKDDLIKYYNCYEGKIEVIPLIPNIVPQSEKNIRNEDLKRLISEKKNYYFYPAQYWPHKNHKYLLDVFNILIHEKKKDFNLIFTGSKKLNFDYLKKIVTKNNLENNIKFFEYLENDEIAFLYKHSQGLLMPTLIGNSCLPLYEAFNFEIPVFYTEGLLDYELRKFVTEFDINNPNDLANKLLSKQRENNIKIIKTKDFYKENFSDCKIVEIYEKILKKFDYQISIYK